MSKSKGMPLPSGAAKEEKKEEKQEESSHFEEKSKEVKQSKLLGSGVEVVALQAGFFKSVRKSPGDKFFVPSLDKVGSWMRCVDPRAEEQAQELRKAKKAGK